MTQGYTKKYALPRFDEQLLTTAVRAHMKIQDANLTVYEDASTMASVMSAELDARLTDAVASAAVGQLADMLRIDKSDLAGFARFLGQSDEFQRFYAAYKAAKRLRGE